MLRILKWFLIVTVPLGVLTAAAYPAMIWLQQQAMPKYLTAPVSRGRVETVVNSTGTIKPMRTVSVGAFTSGPIVEVKVDYNSRVRKQVWFRPPTTLALIDPKLLRAAVERDRATVESSKADLKRVEALLEQAKNNEDRADNLFKKNAEYISPTDRDTFHFTTESLKAQRELGLASIKIAEANLQNSMDNLGYTEITAPEDGIIIERKVDPGQTVASSFTTPELFTIGVRMNEFMHVYASVDEADMGFVRTAKEQKRPVKFTVDAYQGELFEGTVDQIRLNSTTTQNVVTYPVIIQAPNPDLKLMPGMTANLSFQIEVKDNVLRVPAAAFRFIPTAAQVRPEDKHYVTGQPNNSSEGAPKRSAAEKAEQARSRSHRVVWVQEGLLLRAIPLTLGLIDNQFAEVLEGDVSEGQAVVTGTEILFAPR